jgi:hypothetical protein
MTLRRVWGAVDVEDGGDGGNGNGRAELGAAGGAGRKQGEERPWGVQRAGVLHRIC